MLSASSKSELHKMVQMVHPKVTINFMASASNSDVDPNKTGFGSVLLKPNGIGFTQINWNKTSSRSTSVSPYSRRNHGENIPAIYHSLAFSCSCKTYHQRQDPERDKTGMGIPVKSHIRGASGTSGCRFVQCWERQAAVPHRQRKCAGLEPGPGFAQRLPPLPTDPARAARPPSLLGSSNAVCSQAPNTP